MLLHLSERRVIINYLTLLSENKPVYCTIIVLYTFPSICTWYGGFLSMFLIHNADPDILIRE